MQNHMLPDPSIYQDRWAAPCAFLTKANRQQIFDQLQLLFLAGQRVPSDLLLHAGWSQVLICFLDEIGAAEVP